MTKPVRRAQASAGDAGHRFAQLLKAARESKGLRQVDLASLSGVSTRDISALELANPDAKRWRRLADVIVKLAVALDADPSEWLSAVGCRDVTQAKIETIQATLRRRQTTRPTERPLDETALIQEAQEFVKQVGCRNVDIWLIGAAALPLIHSDLVRETWIENLSQGARYHLVWTLDAVDLTSFQDLIGKLYYISEKVPANGTGSGPHERQAGVITHYPLYLLERSTGSIQTPYEELMNNPPPGNHFPFGPRPFEDGAVKRMLLRYWQSFCSIAVYCPTSRIHRPCANLCLTEVQNSRQGPAGPAFHWFNRDAVSELELMINEFRKLAAAWEEQTPDGVRETTATTDVTATQARRK